MFAQHSRSADTDATDTKYVDNDDSPHSSLISQSDNITFNCSWTTMDPDSALYHEPLAIPTSRNGRNSGIQLLTSDYEVANSSRGYVNAQSHIRQLPSLPQNWASSRQESSTSSTECTCECCSIRRKQSKISSVTRCLIIISVISVTFSIFACGLAVFCFVHGLSGSEAGQVEEFEACVRCVELVDEEGVDKSLKGQLTVRTIEDGTEICCAGTRGQVSTLARLIKNHKTNSTAAEDLTSSMFRFSPVSAHKRLHSRNEEYVDEPTSEDVHHRLRLSPENSALTEHSRNILVENNGLEVLYGGWYMVYSGIYFKSKGNKSCGHLQHQTWGHFIVRHNPQRLGDSVTLAQSAHTCCENCTQDNHTSYAAGIFKLETGDHVHVEVSRSGLVMFDSEGSYLGLLMLGSFEDTSVHKQKNTGANSSVSFT